ncbi:MAG: hypothetical protein LBK01_04710 [Burkholderiaceae bacterium]|jgi:hypothetical protein|nr:hypothetical protein [Burkholderiaceae bacterium]
MKRTGLFLLSALFPCFLLAEPAGPVRAFRFAVTDNAACRDEALFQAKIDQIRPEKLAFSVMIGIKPSDAPCTDTLYQHRRLLLNESDKPLFLSLAGSDWMPCTNADGNDIRIPRLQQLREILFEDNTAFGVTGMPLVRQSINPRYRDYPENAWWQYGNILFATLHLPAENNHYRHEAGQNNEFEERTLANRNWLHRIFMLAKRKRMPGIVLLTDGNPLQGALSAIRDGFREIRRDLLALSERYTGRVLLIHAHSASASRRITWKNNVGYISTNDDWLRITVSPRYRRLFAPSE